MSSTNNQFISMQKLLFPEYDKMEEKVFFVFADCILFESDYINASDNKKNKIDTILKKFDMYEIFQNHLIDLKKIHYFRKNTPAQNTTLELFKESLLAYTYLKARSKHIPNK